MSVAKTERVIEWNYDQDTGMWTANIGKYWMVVKTYSRGYTYADLYYFDQGSMIFEIRKEGLKSDGEGKQLCEEFITGLSDVEIFKAGMSDTQRSSREFMQGCGQVTRDTPGDPGAEARLSQFKIIFEEVLELAEATGMCLNDDMQVIFKGYNKSSPCNLTETADALADIIYTCLGMANACGIALKPILDEVCENNLLKLKTGTMNAEGKLVKHPEHPKPDIEKLLKAQGWNPNHEVRQVAREIMDEYDETFRRLAEDD